MYPFRVRFGLPAESPTGESQINLRVIVSEAIFLGPSGTRERQQHHGLAAVDRFPEYGIFLTFNNLRVERELLASSEIAYTSTVAV
jgi:hypothetical protein